MAVPGADLLAVTSTVTTSIASLLLTCTTSQLLAQDVTTEYLAKIARDGQHARLAPDVGPLPPLSVGDHGVSRATA